MDFVSIMQTPRDKGKPTPELQVEGHERPKMSRKKLTVGRV